MYENLNKNSIIDVASTLINEMNSYTPEQQNQLLVEYIIIPFFFIYCNLVRYFNYFWKKNKF
jgi:hypothetical protein